MASLLGSLKCIAIPYKKSTHPRWRSTWRQTGTSTGPSAWCAIIPYSLLKIRYTSNLALWPRENPTLSSEQQVERIEHILSPLDRQIQSVRSNRRDHSSTRLFSVATQTTTLRAMSKWGKFYSKCRNECISLQTHVFHCYTHVTILSHRWSVVWRTTFSTWTSFGTAEMWAISQPQ